MTIGCNIWRNSLKLNWLFYGLSRMLQFSEFVWAPCYSVWDVFNKFLLIDATDRNKISGDQKRFFIELSLYPLSFFANTPFKIGKQRYLLKCYAYCIKLLDEKKQKLNKSQKYKRMKFQKLHYSIVKIFNLQKHTKSRSTTSKDEISKI